MRRPSSLRSALAAASASVLLLAVTACGSDKTDTATDEPSSPSSSSSDSGESEAPADGEEIDPQAFADRLLAATDGLTTAQVSVKMDTQGMAMEAEGSTDYTTSPPSMVMKMKMAALGDQPIEMRLVDGVFYMNMGALSQDKFWKMDPNDSNGPMGDLGDLTDSMDPTKSLDSYADGFQKVVFVGDEDVDGETLAHYAVTVDTAKLKEGQAQVPHMPKTIEYDLWLDDQDVTRKATMDMGDLGTMTMTVDALGEPVQIEAPPANQIAKVPGMMGGA